MRLNILALSYLFPNKAQPAYGIFVLNRLKAIHKYCNIRVIAPIQWYPLIYRVRRKFWRSDIPFKAEFEGIEVYYPRFFVIPRYMKWLDSITYFWVVRSVVGIINRLESFDFDLIDIHWTYPDIVAGYFLAKKYQKKLIVTVRGHEALYLEEKTLRRLILSHFLRKADFIVTLSDELRNIVLNLGIPSEKIRTVLNGVDLSCFFPLDRIACRQKLGLKTQRKIIISVGRLTEGKGHHELVRIMPKLLRTHEVDLYIIGGVNPEDDFGHVLKEMINELKITNVYLIDNVDHDLLPIWYNSADLFCLATKREGCPNVVLEALACGTPVVVTDVGAAREIVIEGNNGFLVKPYEPTSLERLVRTALDRRWNREDISDGMLRWGWASCARKVVSIYQSLIGFSLENSNN